MSRIFVSVAAAALLALGVSCSDDDSGRVGPGDAGEKVTLTVYSGRSESFAGPVLERFERETGIRVRAKYGDTAELAAALAEEDDASPADVFWAQDAGALGAISERGLFAELPSSVLERVPAQFRSTDGLWVGITGRARVAVYNPDLVAVSDLPSSVLDLTGPAWKGKVGWPPTNGSFQAFVTALRLLEGDDVARRWLEGMKDNGAKAYRNNIAVVRAVSQGEVAVGLVNHYYLLEMREEGEDLSAELHFFPGGDPGSLVNVAGAGIVRSSDEPQAAERLLAHLLSTESQEYFAQEVWEYPLVEGVAQHEGLPGISEIEAPDVDLSDLSDLQGSLDLLRSAGLL